MKHLCLLALLPLSAHLCFGQQIPIAAGEIGGLDAYRDSFSVDKIMFRAQLGPKPEERPEATYLTNFLSVNKMVDEERTPLDRLQEEIQALEYDYEALVERYWEEYGVNMVRFLVTNTSCSSLGINSDGCDEIRLQFTTLENLLLLKRRDYQLERFESGHALFFPVLQGQSSDVYYRSFLTSQFDLFSNSLVQLNNNGNTSLFSEVVSGTVGPVRVGLSTQVTSNIIALDSVGQIINDATRTNSLTKFLNGGGNINLAANFPIFHLGQEHIFWRIESNGRVGFDLPDFDDTDQFSTNYEVAARTYLLLSGKRSVSIDNSRVNFFVMATISAGGGNDYFRSLLGLEDKGIAYFKYNGGLSFAGRHNIMFSGYESLNDDLSDIPFTITYSYTPK